MTYHDFERCAVNVTVGMIAGKWKPVILQHLKAGETRFVALWRAIPRVSKKVLLEHLRQLEADGLVGRRELLTFPPEVCYSLTARGTALIPLLQTIDEWAAEHLADQVVYRPRAGQQ